MEITNFDVVQIFYDRIGDKKYMAFDLCIYPVHEILKNIFPNTSLIDKIECLEKNQSTLLVMYLEDLDKYVKQYGFDIFSNVKIIFIHAEFFYNHTKYNQDVINQFVNIKNYEKCYIWEYSSQNIFYYNWGFKNIKYYFLPLLYDKYIEDFYNSKLTNGKIPWEEKDFDIVFIGYMSDRRISFFEEIKKKYKTCIITGNNNYEEMINLVERSKIFVNIFYKETNKAFDYYRLALLYSNNVFVITETPKVNFKVEENLLDLKNIIVTSDLKNMTDTINKYLNLTSKEINDITQKTYEDFKKYTLKDYINKFFI